MKKKYNKDPFETQNWSLRKYKSVKAVLVDIFENDKPYYFKKQIGVLAHTQINAKAIDSDSQQETFRIFLRINSMIELVYYLYKSVNKKRITLHQVLKQRLYRLCNMANKSHWKVEWAYCIQHAYAAHSPEAKEQLWALCYFSTELVDILYCYFKIIKSHN